MNFHMYLTYKIQIEQNFTNQLPLLGVVAAGMPIEMFDNIDYLEVPKSLCGSKNFVLQSVDLSLAELFQSIALQSPKSIAVVNKDGKKKNILTQLLVHSRIINFQI